MQQALGGLQHWPQAAYCAIQLWLLAGQRPTYARPPGAAGIRNAASFEWLPGGELLFAGMERDRMGNNAVRLGGAAELFVYQRFSLAGACGVIAAGFGGTRDPRAAACVLPAACSPTTSWGPSAAQPPTGPSPTATGGRLRFLARARLQPATLLQPHATAALASAACQRPPRLALPPPPAQAGGWPAGAAPARPWPGHPGCRLHAALSHAAGAAAPLGRGSGAAVRRWAGAACLLAFHQLLCGQLCCNSKALPCLLPFCSRGAAAAAGAGPARGAAGRALLAGTGRSGGQQLHPLARCVR